MFNNKGISTIIATIFMILFVMIAAGIVWVVIQNILSRQSEEISSGLDRVTLSIVGSSVKITDSEVSLTINRDIGQGDLTKIKIILYDSEDESYSEDVDAESLTELGNKKFAISKGGLANIEKISIAPITKSASGKESLKGIVYTYKVEEEKFIPTKYLSCLEILNNNADDGDKIYTIYPNGINRVDVYCDMTTDGGGWTLIATNNQPTVFTNFDQDWQSYKEGFGDVTNPLGIGWIGNENINILTSSTTTLQVRTQGYTHQYENWKIASESENYKMTLDYSPDSNDGDLFYNHNGSPFSTYDKDNDMYSGNCAEYYKSGWWFYACYWVSVAGSNNDHVYWRNLEGGAYSVEYIQMWIK